MMQTTLVIHDMNNYQIKKEGKTMKVLCGHCFNKEEYITKKVIVTDVFNKEEVTYFKTIAYCSKCGNEVYVEEIEEKNLSRCVLPKKWNCQIIIHSTNSDSI